MKLTALLRKAATTDEGTVVRIVVLSFLKDSENSACEALIQNPLKGGERPKGVGGSKGKEKDGGRGAQINTLRNWVGRGKGRGWGGGANA